MAERAAYLAKMVRPGTLDVIERVSKAARSEDERDLERELLAAAGMRVSPIDVRRSLSFQAADFVDRIQKSVADVRRAETPQERQAQIRDAAEAQTEHFADLQRKINAARRLGMDPITLNNLLKDAGLRTDVREAMIDGRFQAYLPNTLLGEGTDRLVTQTMLDLISAELSPSSVPGPKP